MDKFSIDETVKNGTVQDEMEALSNAIIKMAADDLLTAMLKENHKDPKNCKIISTPVMGRCNDIPQQRGRITIRRLHMFRFPKYYKEQTMDKFYKYRKEQQ